MGSMPIPNGFLAKENLRKPEPRYPLGVMVCKSCWLMQLTHIIPPDLMFRNYLYIPSTSTTMLKHFESMADSLVQDLKIKPGSLVIDIGSNDGTLLSFFKNQEMKVLGIDPATNLVQIANLKGIETIGDFFNKNVAIRIAKQRGKAALITGTNVLAHVDNIHEVCEGIKLLLGDGGVFVAEFPYLADLLRKNEFDTIYHEHLSYFSLGPLITLFNKHQLVIYDIKKLPTHGGSIRIYVAKKSAKKPIQSIVKDFVREEKLKKLYTIAPYEEFARRVGIIKRDLVSYLKQLRAQGKRIVGYGASAKGNVLMNYCGIDTKLLDYVVDSIPYKQGRYTPGTHIPIFPETRLKTHRPHYALLTAWNFEEEILLKQIAYRERGGQFIITIPYLRIE